MNTKILLNERPHGEPTLQNFKTVISNGFIDNELESFSHVGPRV